MEHRMAMKNPMHPGQVVRHACLEPLGLSVTAGAKVLGVTRGFEQLVNGKSGISPEMAIRLAKAFGSTPETWLRMQLAYDLAAARKNETAIKVRRQRINEFADCLSQRLIQIPDQIFHIFQANREPDQLGRDAGGGLLGRAELLVRGRRRMDHQAARVAHVCQMRKDFQLVDEPLARFVAALHAERKNGARAFGRVFLGQRVVGARGQRRILDPLDALVASPGAAPRPACFASAGPCACSASRCLAGTETN